MPTSAAAPLAYRPPYDADLTPVRYPLIQPLLRREENYLGKKMKPWVLCTKANDESTTSALTQRRHPQRNKYSNHYNEEDGNWTRRWCIESFNDLHRCPFAVAPVSSAAHRRAPDGIDAKQPVGSILTGGRARARESGCSIVSPRSALLPHVRFPGRYHGWSVYPSPAWSPPTKPVHHDTSVCVSKLVLLGRKCDSPAGRVQPYLECDGDKHQRIAQKARPGHHRSDNKTKILSRLSERERGK